MQQTLFAHKVLISLYFNELVHENNPYFKNMFLKHALF